MTPRKPISGKVHFRRPGIPGAACGAGGRYASYDITSVKREASSLITCIRCRAIADRILARAA